MEKAVRKYHPEWLNKNNMSGTKKLHTFFFFFNYSLIKWAVWKNLRSNSNLYDAPDGIMDVPAQSEHWAFSKCTTQTGDTGIHYGHY